MMNLDNLRAPATSIAESAGNSRLSSCEKNLSVPCKYMNFLRQRKRTSETMLHTLHALLPDNASYARQPDDDVYKKGTRRGRMQAEGALSGRSMIEMLGVLAIIGVLSVGAIAGYSKAMLKHKTNKMIGQYNLIFNYITVNKSGWLTSAPTGGLMTLIKKMYIFPEEMIRDSSGYIYDALGNQSYLSKFATYLEYGILISSNSNDIFLSSNNQVETCRTVYQDILKPLHAEIYYTSIYLGAGNTATLLKNTMYYGDAFCSKTYPCIRNISLSTIDSFCRACEQDRNCRLLAIWKL